MTTTMETSVRREVTVAVPVERAFEVFTARMANWWPLDTHHIGAQPAVEAVVEPYAGGRYFERAADGSECDWGSVLVWEPPARVVLAWHLNERWEFDPDPAHASEIEVRFTAAGEGTRVELEHRNFDRHGAGAETIREAVGGDGGWNGLLARFKDTAESR